MQRFKLKSKIHNATITGADLHYEGSLAIDAELMREARIEEYEQVHIYNVSNGARLETYAVPAEPGSRSIIANGAAARWCQPGDRVIIATYALVDEAEDLSPTIIILGEGNRLKEKRGVQGRLTPSLQRAV